MLSARNIYKSYGKLPILKGVDLEVNRGEIISIVGASGAGKSTLLHIIGSLTLPDQGTVEINGVEINSLSAKKLSEFRNKNIGFIFQFHHLLPEFSALENVCMPAFIAKKGKKESEMKAEELLEMLGLDHRMHHKPSELSGGEQQRVAVARALINNPSVILADEPSGNLDEKAEADVFKRLKELSKSGKCVIVVSHSNEVKKYADKVLKIVDGKLVGDNHEC